MKYKLPKWAVNLFPIRAAYEKGFEDFNDVTKFNDYFISSDEYVEYERGWNAAYFKQLKTTRNIEKSKARKDV